MCHFWTHTRQLAQALHTVRYVTVIVALENLGSLLQMLHFRLEQHTIIFVVSKVKGLLNSLDERLGGQHGNNQKEKGLFVSPGLKFQALELLVAAAATA